MPNEREMEHDFHFDYRDVFTCYLIAAAADLHLYLVFIYYTTANAGLLLPLLSIPWSEQQVTQQSSPTSSSSSFFGVFATWLGAITQLSGYEFGVEVNYALHPIRTFHPRVFVDDRNAEWTPVEELMQRQQATTGRDGWTMFYRRDMS